MILFVFALSYYIPSIVVDAIEDVKVDKKNIDQKNITVHGDDLKKSLLILEISKCHSFYNYYYTYFMKFIVSSINGWSKNKITFSMYAWVKSKTIQVYMVIHFLLCAAIKKWLQHGTGISENTKK